MNNNEKKKALVVSVGGAYGAWSTGLLEVLGRVNTFDCAAGSSTGAGIAAFGILGDWRALSKIYLSLDQKTIYSVDPFNKRGKISIPNLSKRLFRSLFKITTSLGEAENLRRIISKHFTYDHYLEIQKQGKELIIGAQETRTNVPKVYYVSNTGSGYELLRDFIFYSMSAPIIMPPQYRKLVDTAATDLEWVDAGLTNPLPLKEVLRKGYKDITVIMHRHVPLTEPTEIYPPIKDIPHAAVRFFNIMRDQLELLSLSNALDYARRVGAKVNIYWMPREIVGDGLYFNRDLMKKWHDLGLRGEFSNQLYDFSNEGINIKNELKKAINDVRVISNYINANMSRKKKQTLVKELNNSLNTEAKKPTISKKGR